MGYTMRCDVPVEETWDLSLIYESRELAEKDYNACLELAEKIEKEYRGKLCCAEAVNRCLDGLREVQRLLTLLCSYSELAVSVDYYNSENQQLDGRFTALNASVMSRLSFIDSELCALSDEELMEAADASCENRGYILDLIRSKPHRLSPEGEKLMAALANSFSAPYQIYNMAKLADMKFPSFNASGTEYALAYSLFEENYEYDADTELRRRAFEEFSKKLKEYENVTAAAYNACVSSEKTISVLRGYDSVFDYLLFDQKVTREMYDRQIDIIMEKLAPHMRKYAGLLKRVHGLEKMTVADLKIAVDPEYDPKLTVAQAREYAEKGLAILGEEYTDMVKEAFEKRWFDFANNQGKTTGGFCASPYGKNSFILMSYNNRMADVLTIAHELGHAGHFRSCNNAQSIFDTNVSTYFVEAPSTMNELLMAHYLLKTTDDKRFRRWVLSNIVGNTYYHNCVTHLLEAHYQREVYRIIDAGGSVQADTLNELYRDTLRKFWSDDVEINDGAELTWMRQPHYYMGLYSYTYSAGLTVATQVCKRIENEGQTAVDDWKRVLTAGSTKTPAELAAMAGVDISNPAALEDTIAVIGEYIDEICRLTEEIEK